MFLKHCKKFTAAEITKLVKITKQEVAAVEKGTNTMLMVLIVLMESMDSTVLLSRVLYMYFQVIQLHVILKPGCTSSLY